jgi:hypothetical protein
MFTPSQHILIDRYIYDSVWNKPVQLIIERLTQNMQQIHAACPFNLPTQSVETAQTLSNIASEVLLNKLRALC